MKQRRNLMGRVDMCVCVLAMRLSRLAEPTHVRERGDAAVCERRGKKKKPPPQRWLREGYLYTI